MPDIAKCLNKECKLSPICWRYISPPSEYQQYYNNYEYNIDPLTGKTTCDGHIPHIIKPFKGKAIYNPTGKAAEYSRWACNFYVGCSNGCTYCYCKKGILKNTMGLDQPKLKACFKDEKHALEVFKEEVDRHARELRKYGLFFSFTTDPMIAETHELTVRAVSYCNQKNIPVSILTKEVGYIYLIELSGFLHDKALVSVGFTLTGHDELEPNASSNYQRIRAMELCKHSGCHTFASIEPIIDFESAQKMIERSIDYCDLYKIGLMSGKKYDVVEARAFVSWLSTLKKPKIYLKESLQKLTGYTNEEFGEYFVDRDYIFRDYHLSK